MSVLVETIDTNTEFVVRLSLRPWPPSESFRAGMPPHHSGLGFMGFECSGLGYIEPKPFSLASGSVKASPKGPCTKIVCTLALKYLYRDYIKAKVNTKGTWTPS